MAAWELGTKPNADKSKPESWTERIKSIGAFNQTDPNTDIDAPAGDVRPDINAGTIRLSKAGLVHNIATYLPTIRSKIGRDFKDFADLKVEVQEYGQEWRAARRDTDTDYTKDQIWGVSWIRRAVNEVKKAIDAKKIREPGG